MHLGIAVTVVVAIVMTAGAGIIVIPWLKKLKYGQTILEIGPRWHKSKEGTPTMGGVMIILGTVVAFIVGCFFLWNNGDISLATVGRFNLMRAVSALIMAVCFAFVGFLDDYIKIRKKHNEGLTEPQKLVFQVLIVAAYFTARFMSGNTLTSVTFPFLGSVDLSYFYYIVVGLGMIYLVNAVNFTDGVDGLCSSVTVIYSATFVVITSLIGLKEMGILAAACGGACLGFLFWNFHPAKVFMGDTGSMFLGGIVCGLGVGCGVEFAMVVAAAVYIWEALTVLIQRIYFKATKGKRLFKMTPIHHSFEMSGYSEVKIVSLFSALGLIAGIIAVMLIKGY